MMWEQGLPYAPRRFSDISEVSQKQASTVH